MEDIEFARVNELIDQGAILLDIRELEEMEEVIDKYSSYPLSDILEGNVKTFDETDRVIFYCRSGRRTTVYEDQLIKAVSPVVDIYRIKGGINAWKDAGLKVEHGPASPHKSQPAEAEESSSDDYEEDDHVGCSCHASYMN